jgi:hypothetical protein
MTVAREGCARLRIGRTRVIKLGQVNHDLRAWRRIPQDDAMAKGR